MISQLLTDPAVALASALAAACLFATAAAPKLRDPSDFAAQIVAYELIPASVASGLSRAIPVIQLMLSFALVPDSTRALSAIGLAVLNLVFAAAVSVNLIRGHRRMDCGCSLWGDGQELQATMLLRNGYLLALLALSALPDEASRTLSWADLPAVLSGGFALSAVYAIGDLTLRNHYRLNPAGEGLERSSR